MRGRIRTCDLQGMSLTRHRTAPPRAGRVAWRISTGAGRVRYCRWPSSRLKADRSQRYRSSPAQSCVAGLARIRSREHRFGVQSGRQCRLIRSADAYRPETRVAVRVSRSPSARIHLLIWLQCRKRFTIRSSASVMCGRGSHTEGLSLSGVRADPAAKAIECRLLILRKRGESKSH